MKQSTSFAQVANYLLNVLQGYTKGIRFVAVLTVLLTMGIGQAWAEGTETFENLTSVSSYGSRSWTGVNGQTWSATLARTDQKISGNRGLTFSNANSSKTITMKLTDAQKAAGIGTFTFKYKHPYSDSGKTNTFSISVNGSNYSSGTLSYTSSNTTKTITINAVPNSTSITITITGTARLCVDDFSWTSYVSAASYTVTYNANGGSGTMTQSTGSSITLKECTFTAPSGKEFDEWNTAANGSGTSYQAGDIVNKSLNLYAIWKELPKYTVTFHTTATSETELTEDAAGAGVNPPTMEEECGDWTFQGWSKLPSNSETSTTKLDLVITLDDGIYYPTADAELYPVYTKSEGGGGTEYVLTDIGEISSGDIFVFADASNYALTNNNGTSSAVGVKQITVSNSKITSTVDATIEWQLTGNNTNGYTFYPGTGTTTWLYCNTTASSSNNNNMRVGTGDRKLFVVNNNGYLVTNDTYTNRYLSRYNTQDFRGYINTNTNPVNPKLYKKTAGSTTYYYSYPQCTTETTVTLQPNGGTGTAQVLETTDGSLTLPKCDFTYEGYRFVGWNTKANGTGTTYQPSAKYTPTENPATLYAKWAKEYTVTYNANGGTKTCEDNKKYIAGEQVTVCTSAPTRDSYTFNGWSYSPSVAITDGQFTMPENDVTITAQWTSNKTATSLSWSPTSYSATIDADNTFPELTKTPDDLTGVTYSSSNTTVATIDVNTGEITLNAAGTTTITAEFTETTTHTGAKASYTLTVHPSNCRWVEVTDNTTLEDGDEVVVMMAHGANIYALPYDKDKASNSNPVATPITLDAFESSIADELIWFITKDHESNNFTLSPKTATDKYLTCNASNNAVRINTGANRNFTIEKDFLKNTAFSTYLAISTTATPKDWRHFESTNTTISSKAQTLKFYKRECLDATNYWVEDNFINVTCDTQLPQQLAKDGSITLTFTAADGYELPNNVTVTNATKTWNQATGKLTISNPTGNVLVTVEAVKYYTVTWKPAGGNWSGDTNDKVVKYEAGDKIVAPAIPTYDCHEFLGWTPAYPADMTMPAENLEFTATWNKLSYTITFKNYDGTVLQTSTVECGETPTYTGATPTREQTAQYTYTFKAWSPTIAPATQDQVYTAQFNQTTRSYTVIWYDGTGNAHKTQTANYNATVALPTTNPDPCDDEYPYFIGWTADPIVGSTTTQPELVENVKVTGDCDYYAVFAKGEGGSSNYQKVTSALDDWSGEYLIVYETGKVAFNGGLSTLDAASNTIGVTISDNTIESNSTTDAARFTIAAVSGGYTIKSASGYYIGRTANSNGLNSSNSQTYTNTISYSSTVSINGSSNGSTTALKFNNASNQNRFRYYTSGQQSIALYKKGSGVNYTSFITNCCATPVPTNGSYTSPSGTSVTLTWDGESTRYHITCANPIIDEHTESTSYEVSSLTECEEYTFYVSAHPKDGCESEAIAITAQPFSGAKTVTLNYNGNGQANTTSSTSCGNTSITLPTPTWAGYRFMGWYTAANGGDKVNENPYSPDADITLYAQWEKEYTVTYNTNGGSTSCSSGNYIAGETVIVCTTNPSKTGHTFTGWTYSPSVIITDGKFVMPASDVTITAQWQVNSYTVTWKPNGGNWGGSTANIVETYEYGATIVQPAAPQRDGYRFTGWNYSIPATMPAGNATYTAQWKQNYTITFYDGNDVTPWTQTKDAESINLTEYLGTLACDDYQFAGWSTDATKYDDEPANITTWVTGNYTPTANIDLYAVYTKGAVTNDFTLNCDGGVYEIWVNNTAKNHMAGRLNGGGYGFQTTEYWDQNNTESNGAPFTITKVADKTYTLQNADGQYITGNSYEEDDLNIEDTWESADKYKWTISAGSNGTWRFTNKASSEYALVFYDRYFQLRKATNVTLGSAYYDLELTPAASNVYQSNPNCGPYYIIFNTHGGEFIQGEEYPYGEEQTGLTETTYAKFPAAELEGYTFAGWKDGSPIDDEITADNASDAPYLKQAGEDLVVSSNKTYHAVYYYYDEEEDIDFSKEFTTSIYAEVNGMKYFLAGTPSSGTMSSTTDCGYVSEVTITPGTGANAGKYKITVNGVAMAPKANETDLLNGTYWWTITERSVGSGEYKISGQDKKNLVLFNSSWGHYTYNQGSEYGNNYYYPRFGKCIQHHWTSNPTLKPSLNLSGDVYVTATNARGVMATSTLKVSAKQLNANEKVNITSNSNDVYFSADCTVNFVKANKPTNTLTITASPSGVIEQDIYVHYKPNTEGNGTPASVVVSANLATPDPSVTDDQIIHVRNLPTKFVIATKVGATWYALPADMSSATNPLGVVIEVDETTMTTIAPNTTTYTLWPVKTTATENDRYTNITGVAYGDRVRFAAVNYEQRGLWANNNNNGSTIRDYAKIDALGADALAAYEWKVTTTVVDGHWQYTLQTDQTQNQNYLRYWTSAEGTPVGPKWGTYNAGENKLYFLPVTETKPFDYKVVEWYPTKVLIQTEAAITNPIVKIGGVLVGDVTCTNKGGKLYEISNLPLETNPNKLLQISFTDNAINYINTKVVPIILSRGEKTITGEPFATLTQKVYQYADVVVRDGATLSIDGTTDVANTLLGVTIYPTAKVSVEEGKKLSVHSLTFFGGIDEIYDGSAYTINKYGVPQLSLNGTLNKTVTNMDYIMRVDLKQMYSLTVPYDVQLADIKYWDGSDIALGSALYVSAYDGEARANQSKKTWIYETDFESRLGAATLKAGVGYTISAELQAGVGNEYSILRMPMMSNVASGATEAAKTVAVTAWGINANITDNHKGWNLVGNPYMTTIQGADDDDLVLGYLKETGTGPWEWVEKTYRYVTIPSDDGTYYLQQMFTDAVLPPFKNFFVQVGTTGELAFGLGTRQSMPARSTQAAIEQEVEFEIFMSNDARQDNTGLLISEEYSPAYEINADLEKMIGSMSVYTIFGGYKLAYNALSPINASEWIPMGYIAPAAGEYTFRLDDVEKIVEQVEHVYVIDYDANNIVDLMTDEYKFTTNKEQNDNRFAINVVLIQDKDNTTTGMDIINGNVAAPIKFIHQDKMYIYNEGIIYDATGKQVTNINK